MFIDTICGRVNIMARGSCISDGKLLGWRSINVVYSSSVIRCMDVVT